MKKLIALTLLIVGLSVAAIADNSPFAFNFAGRWQPAEDALVSDDFGLQNIQNMRKDGKRFKGVSGHTKITENVVNATYNLIRNGFHFTKDQPQESHVLVWSRDSANTDNKVYDNTTAIADAGEFSAAVLFDNSSSDIGQFSRAPQGNVLYANGDQSAIWGGNELRVAAFLSATATVTTTVTNASDYSEKVQSTSSDANKVAAIAAATNKVMLVGSTRPLKGVKFYVSTANTGTPSLTNTKYWNGSWTALSNVVDGTSGLKTTGSVTFDSTVSDAQVLYLEGFSLYWYQFELSAGSATINHVTVDAPFQELTNIWDGSEDVVASFKKYNGTTFIDYTDEVNTEDTTFAAILDALESGHAIYTGFAFPQQALDIRVSSGEENSNASVLTVKYWNGTAWTAVSNAVDGTSEGGATFGKSGVISFSPVSEALEFKTQLADEEPVFYYQLTVSATLSASVDVYYVTGFYNPEEISGYRFPGLFQNRSFLFSEKEGQQNKAIYSSENSPSVWNGPDTGGLFFGNETKLTGAGTIYNIYKTTGIDQLIVTKQNETYRVFGTGPSDWVVQNMSTNVGCVAPLSIAICETSDFRVSSGEPSRHVMMWQSDNGVIMCDGASVQLISDDIRVYWDENDSRAIPADRMDDSYGWYDSNLNSYKLLISSGAGQATHNVELEFSLKTNEWTKLYRENSDGANPIQAGFETFDTEGNTYTYGTTDEGFMYRLENGSTFGGTPIEQIIWTKDLLLDSEKPYFVDTVINYLRLSFIQKDGDNLGHLLDGTSGFILDHEDGKIITNIGEYLDIDHYCNRSETQGGVNNQYLPALIDPNDGPFETPDVTLGPCLSHSFKFTFDNQTLNDGFELTGMGLYFDPQNTVSQD